MEKWFINNRNSDKIEYINKFLKDKLCSKLLANRGVVSFKDIFEFFKDDNDIYDLKNYKDIDKFFEIIDETLREKKSILVVGDYDVDGVCSTIIILKALKNLGFNVSYRIPQRDKEGYGINKTIIEEALKEDIGLIFTCDNGIAAFEEIKYARDNKINVIVSDHHEIPVDEEGRQQIVEADVVIDPKLEYNDLDFKDICGAFLVLKLMYNIYIKYGADTGIFDELIQYASLATVCDMMPLISENRSLIKRGLELMNKNPAPAIKSIVDAQDLKGEISVYHIGFIIGPCINAAGRLSSANIAVEFFMTELASYRQVLTLKLKQLNDERKLYTEQGFICANDIVEKDCLNKDKVILVYSDKIEKSVAGIVAGRIKEKYNMPSIVMNDCDGVLVGSARSIENYNIFENLSRHKHLFIKFGGHKMAAGFSIKKENIEDLRNKLNKFCNLSEEDFIKIVRADTFYAVDYVDLELIKKLKKLEPYGESNPEPLFADKNLELFNYDVFGKNRNVIKLKIKTVAGNYKNIVIFEKEEIFKDNFYKVFKSDIDSSILNRNKKMYIDIIYSVKLNEYKGIKNADIVASNYRFKEVSI